MNAYAEFRPNLWQRIAWWQRWPWRPRPVPFDQRAYGAQPYLVVIRENDTLIGWHPVDWRPAGAEVTTFVVPSRWACLLGIFKPPMFEVEISRDPEWRAPLTDNA